MRVERLSDRQFTIYMTFDDLIERGFTKEDLWEDLNSVQSLFSDMMYEASAELGFELGGVLLVQVHLMQAQGMHVTVTRKSERTHANDEFVEMKVTLDESKEFIFSFVTFEDIIQLAHDLHMKNIDGGKIYHMEDRYYLKIDKSDLRGIDRELIIAIILEFSSPSIVTSARLEEYGKVVMEDHAVEQIMAIFHT